jgi:hypothetical protein
MEYVSHTKEELGNGNIIHYKKTVSGTFYHEETSDEVVEVLERARENGTRLTLDYGDVKTGESWGEVYDINGYVGRSNGRIKIPLLIHNNRSMGGGSVLDHCIIGIYTSKGKRPLYILKVK